MENGNFKFLIIGAGRGGTSLLAGLLDSHSQLEVAMEKFARDYLMGSNPKPHLFKEACVKESKRYPGKLWGNKITTEQMSVLNDKDFSGIHHFFQEVLRGIKIIFILRDGRACVRSKMERKGLTLEEACCRWKYSVKIYQYLLASNLEKLTVTYEDLVVQPETVLKRICVFLGVSYESGMLEGVSSPKMQINYRKSYFDRSKLTWEEFPKEHLPLIQEELLSCGYSY